MKKIILTLAVLILAAPALGSIDITCDCNNDTNEVTVTVADSESGRPRAFALDFTASNDANIVSVSGLNAGYGIYPGQIDINAITGDVDNYGSAVCDSGYPGTLGGLGTPGMTIEMGSLYDGEVNAPDANGVLLKFVVDVNNAIGSDIGIVANVIRGGSAVMEDLGAVTVNLTGCSFPPDVVECFPSGHPDYTEWLAVGSPDSWCYPSQCYGDADGLQQDVGHGAMRSVAGNDVAILVAGYKLVYGGDPDVDTWIAADFDHAEQDVGHGAMRRVAGNDVSILVTYYKITPIATDCLDVP